jgi:hypothetical protein
VFPVRPVPPLCKFPLWHLVSSAVYHSRLRRLCCITLLALAHILRVCTRDTTTEPHSCLCPPPSPFSLSTHLTRRFLLPQSESCAHLNVSQPAHWRNDFQCLSHMINVSSAADVGRPCTRASCSNLAMNQLTDFSTLCCLQVLAFGWSQPTAIYHVLQHRLHDSDVASTEQLSRQLMLEIDG